MVVREPTEEDSQALREVKSLAVQDLRKVYRPIQAGHARRAAKARDRRPLVCECNGRVAGCVEYEPQGDRLHVIGLLVHPDFRRRGIARAILEYIRGIAQCEGKRGLSLNTVKQTGNIEIFTRLGFEVVKESEADESLGGSVTDDQLVDVYMESYLR